MSEAQFLTAVLDLCEIYGVLVHHCYDGRLCEGSGLPDLIIVGRHRVLFAELKSDRGQLSSKQTTWRYKLIAAGAYWVCWTPADLDNGAVASALSEL